MTAPPLFLDVDGPLNPYAASRDDLHRAGYRSLGLSGVLLHPGHGRALLDLPYTLVWATTWEHAANDVLSPLLGLPRLPVVEWPEAAPAYGALSFKTPTLVDRARGRPFAWVDDDIDDADRAFVADHHDAPALLHRVDPAVGLTPGDFAALAAWAPASLQQ